MVRKIKPVAKNSPNRERKQLILIGAEGKNKTEALYFRELEKTQKRYHFLFAAGNETDPVKIVRNTAKSAQKEQLKKDKENKAFAVFDIDADKSKAEQLSQAKTLAEKSGITVVTSNPCFEVWYREHFKYTSRPYGSGEDVIRDLRKWMPKYEKNTCDFKTLKPLTAEAINNCRQLEQHHKESGQEKMPEFENPRTDIYKIVEMLTVEVQ